jgi:hypothetical protein
MALTPEGTLGLASPGAISTRNWPPQKLKQHRLELGRLAPGKVARRLAIRC